MIRQSNELNRIAALAVDRFHASPGASVSVCTWTRDGWQVETGAAGRVCDDGPDATPNTPYDLASVTKPFVALTLARLVHEGLLSWEMPLDVPVQESIRTHGGRASLEQLAAHRAGLLGHLPLYEPLRQGKKFWRYESLQRAARAVRPECEKNDPRDCTALYSDLGYMLLGEALSRATGRALDELVLHEILEPLGLTRTGSARQWRRLDARFDQRVAPTERVAWRGGVIRGWVHDENAFALEGDGMCGHAGLFGTASDVARLGAAIVDALRGRKRRWLSTEPVERLVRPRAGGTLRAGFDGKSPEGSMAGSVCGPNTFGHLGFTGTSLWIDPDAQVVTVLLTNRVYPTRDSTEIRQARPAVHDALFSYGLRAVRAT